MTERPNLEKILKLDKSDLTGTGGATSWNVLPGHPRAPVSAPHGQSAVINQHASAAHAQPSVGTRPPSGSHVPWTQRPPPPFLLQCACASSAGGGAGASGRRSRESPAAISWPPPAPRLPSGLQRQLRSASAAVSSPRRPRLGRPPPPARPRPQSRARVAPPPMGPG